jgi:O-methyltransferase
MLKPVLKSVFRQLGWDIRRLPRFSEMDRRITPDAELYRPLFSPWFGADFQRHHRLAAKQTLVSEDRCYILLTLLRQAIHLEGNVWECGVYRGGTAAMLANFLSESTISKKLYLFDTFEGMPETDISKDRHRQGDFQDTSVEAVAKYVGHSERCIFRKGLIPHTFAGLEPAIIAFAHIDVDIHRSILDCLDFIWPRLAVGGVIVFDDYGFPSCPGARTAVDEFFASRVSVPLCLPTGQALVFKAQSDAISNSPG